MLIWALEALVESKDRKDAKALCWALEGKQLVAEAKVAAGSATEPETGAIALMQTFLDEARATLGR